MPRKRPMLVQTRVDPDLYDRVCAAAAADGRPMANFVAHVLGAVDWDRLRDEANARAARVGAVITRKASRT